MECRRGIERDHQCVSVRGQHGPCLERVREAGEQVAGVERFAGDVAAGAFVRNRQPGDLHAAASACCSHQNFASRFWASASR